MASPGSRKPVVLGVAGTGAISQVMHLPILTERSDVRLAAVSDQDDMKARTIGLRFDVPRIVDDEGLLRDDEIEGVVICAPSYLHEELAIAAMEAGKHVLVERPLALTAAGVERVLQAAKASDRRVIVGMAHRYRPDVSALRAFVAGGELGSLTSVRAAWLNRRVRHIRSTWRQRVDQAGGGALMDLGVQALDLAMWIMGYPEVERVTAMTYADEFEVEDEAHLTAITRDGVTLSLATSWRFHGPNDRHQVRVLGSDGGAYLPPLAVFKQLGGRPMDVTPRQPIPRGGEDLFTNGYRRQLDYFVRVVAGEADATPPSEQKILMALIEGAYTSAREGREIPIG